METHNKFLNILPKLGIIPTCMPDKEKDFFVEQSAVMHMKRDEEIYSIWEKMKEEQMKHIQKCKDNQEKALIQAIQSCDYQYDEVMQYLKIKRRFEINRLQFGNMFDGHIEYVLYDSYTQRAFLLAIETNTMVDYGYISTIESYKNKQVPFNYHR